MVTVAAVLLASAQVPLRAIVTAVPDLVPVVVPVQVPVKPLAKVTVGVDGMPVNAELKVTVIVSPVVSAPAELDVKPAVQVAVAPLTCDEPLNVTPLAVPAKIVTAEAGFAAVSLLVVTLNVFAA